MNVESILRDLWPIVKPRAAAALARGLQALAAKWHGVLSDADALNLAVMVTNLLEELLTDPPVEDAALVQAAAERLA